MSRIGKLPIKLTEGVKVEIEGQTVKVTGPKGSLSWRMPKGVTAQEREGQIFIITKPNNPKGISLAGTNRALINNMVLGVSDGWKKELELVGTGYRAEVSGGDLALTVGYSHPVKIKAPDGITFRVEKSAIFVEGADKEQVGQIAAIVQKVKPPEPYKGKGILYKGQVIKRKAGKAAKTQAA